MSMHPSCAALRKILLGSVAALVLPLTAGAQSTLPTASQVASNIKLGWNIGNTLEASGGETAWGNPAVTQQLISAVKAAGFNAIRIPAAWDSHANQSTLQIDSAWLARVKEVVDYAHGQGMYVVLNIHWDGGWLEEHPFYSYQYAVNNKQRAYWTQIANYFKGYNERLLFAGTNEVRADYGTPTTEHITVQQSYLQTFVDAVRATGGNNASRTLVVQTYNTNIWHGLNYFTLPTDTISSRLMVEVHHYDPYDFTLNQSGSCIYWGSPYPSQSACSWAQESYHDDLFSRVKSKWVSKGVPVMIGEHGVATRSSISLASRQYWLEYINRSAAANGIKTFYWDNGVLPSQNNGFALFNRYNGSIVDQGALSALLRGAGVSSGTQYTLSTAKSGSGTGTITSSPSGINCGSTCSAGYSSGTAVTLTASPASGSTFAGWSGACSGTGSCTVSMSAARSVTATFNSSSGSGTCANPITFSGSTGSFNTTGAVCYRTNIKKVKGWGCYNFDGRSVTVGGQSRSCGQTPLTKSSDGYYYFSVSAGSISWASLSVW
jgi:aryl-phospho-beta-D-glucosidase BglC (GH1 family)